MLRKKDTVYLHIYRFTCRIERKNLDLRNIKEGIHADIREQGRQSKGNEYGVNKHEGLCWKGKKAKNVQGPLVQGRNIQSVK
jgi:hypothetical protein